MAAPPVVRKTALIIDDTLLMRRLLRRHLEQAGFDVVEAGDGQEGLRRVRETGARVVLTDWNMPVMDGLDVARALRKEAAHRFLPIVILTTDLDAEKQAVARAAGVTACVAKPFDGAEVAALAVRLCPDM